MNAIVTERDRDRRTDRGDRDENGTDDSAARNESKGNYGVVHLEERSSCQGANPSLEMQHQSGAQPRPADLDVSESGHHAGR